MKFYNIALGITILLGVLGCGYLWGETRYQQGLIDRDIEISKEMESKSWETLWSLVNKYKVKKGLPELKVSDGICRLAEKRASEVSRDWSHDGFMNTVKIAYSAYCPECGKMGENLSRGFTDPQEILTAWINSPTHKEILDSPDTRGCLGYYVSNNELFVAYIAGR